MNKPRIIPMRGSQWWWFSWYTPEGRKQYSCQPLGLSIHTHDRDQAQAALEEHFGFRAKSPEPGTETLGWFLSELPGMLERDGLRDQTRDAYVKALKKLVSVLGPNYPVRMVSKVPHVAILKDELAKTLNAHSINSRLNMLRVCFSRLVDRGIIDKNPFSRFKPVRTDETKPAHLTVEQMQRFLAAVDTWQPPKLRNKPVYYEAMKKIVRLYLYLAKRRAELPMIHREHIDIDAGTILIPDEKKPGMPLAEYQIPDEVRGIVQWFLDTFPGPHPFRFCELDQITRYTKLWLRVAGLPESLHLHSIRHSAITYMIDGGMSPREVQEYVGHTTVQITEGYIHRKKRRSAAMPKFGEQNRVNLANALANEGADADER